MSDCVWPEVFLNGEREYSDKKQATTDAYHGWALCLLNSIPDKFGVGMVYICDYLGVDSVVPGDLDNLCKELGIDDK